MKRRSERVMIQMSLWCVGLLASTLAVALPVTSEIEAVTVYQAGAMVTRSARIDVPRGVSQVTFEGLSSAVNAGNVRLEVAQGNAELGQIRFDRVQTEAAYDAQVRDLTEQIETVEALIGELEDRGKTAELKLKFLDGIAAGYAKESWFEGARGTADVESWRAALNVLEDGAAAARATIREVKVAGREQQKVLSRLQRELRDLRGGSLSASRLNVALNAAAAQEVTVLLHYFVESATWSPVYEARLDSNAGALRLLQKAEVRQTTDEDWQDAVLTLSTSDPSGALAAPVPTSEFLDLVEVQPPMAKRSAPMALATDAIEEIVVSGAARERATEVGAYAVNYRIPGRVNVANDADEAQTFELATFEMAAELVTRIVPRQSLDAFLTAQFTYDADVPLYASSLQVYVDRVFVGESWMPTALPGQEMVLPMGQDRQVEFSLQDQGGEKGEGGFIGRTKTERTDLVFEITNRRRSLTTVEVIDVLPVAINKDIDVALGDDATPATEADFDDKRGVLVWRRNLSGGDTWRIRHEYEVEYPASKVLVRQRR